MNTLKYMELPTLWFLSCWKSSQDTRHLGKPGSGIQAWEEGTLSGKTPSFPIEKMLPPVGAQCLSPGAPLVTLGQSPSPELCPPWGAGSSPTEIGAGKDTAALPRPPPALSPSATSLHLLNPPGQWPHHCPGQPGLGWTTLSGKTSSPISNLNLPWQLGAISFCPVTYSLGEEPDPSQKGRVSTEPEWP